MANRVRPMLWWCPEAPHVDLIGTMHSLDNEPPAWVEDVCAHADVVVLEADMSNVPALPRLPEPLRLSRLGSPVAMQALALADRLGLELDYIDSLYPYGAALELVRTAAHSALKYPGIDRYLQANARRSPFYLETAQEFFAGLFATSMEAQLAGLEVTLERLPTMAVRLRGAAAAWWRGDLEQISQVLGFTEMQKRASELANAMLAQRNGRWAPKAAGAIQATATFGKKLVIGVGCAHLSGDDSLLAFLQQHGYRFEQVG